MRRVLLFVAAVALIAGCGTSGRSAGSSRPLQKLQGKQLPDASGGWIAIASPFKTPVDVAGTDTPPVQTNSTSNTVAFFEFRTPAAAAAFYRVPPLAARLIASGIQRYQPLAGPTGIPKPSRGLDLRECLWKGGPGQGGTAGQGTPSGGVMNSSGACSKGTPSSSGVAIIVQRGRYVVLSEAFGRTVIGHAAPAAALTDPALGASKYADSALTLMQTVRLKLS